MTASSVQEWLTQARQSLAGLCDLPGLEAQVMLAHAAGRPRSWLAAHPEASLNEPTTTVLNNLLARRLAGEPLPYIIGRWEFFGLEFLVTPDVLIPRPETELLVEQAIQWLDAHPEARLAADAGTGSGCIAISLAAQRPGLHVIATDSSQKALAVAKHNTLHHKISNVHLVQTDLLAGVHGPLSLVCANLPYIPSARVPGLEVSLHEPRLALDGGPDGFALIQRLLQQAQDRLAQHALMLCELDSTQANIAAQAAQNQFPGAGISILEDHSGLPRILMVEVRSQ